MSHSYKKVSRTGQKKDRFFKRLQHSRNRMLERLHIWLDSRQYKHTVNDYDICDWDYVIWDKRDCRDELDLRWYERGRRK